MMQRDNVIRAYNMVNITMHSARGPRRLLKAMYVRLSASTHEKRERAQKRLEGVVFSMTTR